jgi:hypothetical protein
MNAARLFTSVVGACALLASPAPAVIVFQDNFDTGTSAGSWTGALSGADASVNYAFNYSTLGIPSAPNSTGASTIGMRFLANQSAGVFQGISASPNSQSFAGDFKLNFDMWLNYAGPLGVGGSGTTQLATFGWGSNGTGVQWPGLSSSVLLATSLDGGSAQDYRLYKNNAQDTAVASYAAASQNNSATYYTSLYGAQSAPSGQITLFPGQTGSTDAGEVAFRWVDVEIQRVGSLLTWRIDGNPIASTDVTGLTLSGSNIFFGLSDTNAASSTDANDFLIAAIYDNIRVDAIPEPGVTGLGMLCGAALFLRRRRNV